MSLRSRLALRQLQRVDQRPHLLACGDVRHPRLAAAGRRRLVEHVEHGQALQEQLAEDHALAEPGRQPEADALRQLVQHLTHLALVVGLEVGEPVAHDDPVDRAAVALGAGLALVPDHLGIDARPQDVAGAAVDMSDHVEVDEAVVHRGDQGVGVGVRGAGQEAVGAGAVDDHIVGLAAEATEDRLEADPVLLLRLLAVHLLGRCEEEMPRHRQRHAVALHGGRAVRQVARQGPLPGVEVDGADLVAQPQQGDDQMHRGRGLAGTALLAADDDDMRRGRCGRWRCVCVVLR